MSKERLLATAMAQECGERIRSSKDREGRGARLPKQLRPAHLLWMCERVEKEGQEWPVTKLHRWIGFVQCAMMANGLLDFKTAKEMFQCAKNAYGEDNVDLTDHLDSNNAYRLELGGEG